jgi:hypothetical protein
LWNIPAKVEGRFTEADDFDGSEKHLDFDPGGIAAISRRSKRSETPGKMRIQRISTPYGSQHQSSYVLQLMSKPMRQLLARLPGG